MGTVPAQSSRENLLPLLALPHSEKAAVGHPEEDSLQSHAGTLIFYVQSPELCEITAYCLCATQWVVFCDRSLGETSSEVMTGSDWRLGSGAKTWSTGRLRTRCRTLASLTQISKNGNKEIKIHFKSGQLIRPLIQDMDVLKYIDTFF